MSIKLKPQDVESSSTGTAIGGQINRTHILQEFQPFKETKRVEIGLEGILILQVPAQKRKRIVDIATAMS